MDFDGEEGDCCRQCNCNESSGGCQWERVVFLRIIKITIDGLSAKVGSLFETDGPERKTLFVLPVLSGGCGKGLRGAKDPDDRARVK